MGNIFSETKASKKIFKLYTFGDSVLDCGRYNEHSLDPGRLIIENNDKLFPEFKGKDLNSMLNIESQLIHSAIDGSTVNNLIKQLNHLNFDKNQGDEVYSCAIVSIGGNDCLGGMIKNYDSEIGQFEKTLRTFLEQLPIRPVFISSIYDPTHGDDQLNFFGGDAQILRENQAKINNLLKKLGEEFGAFVDLHEHFLKNGTLEWFVNVIEPSVIGASEIRRCFLEEIIKYLNKNKLL
jgi:acyl-CoA thioesterase I